MSEPSSLLADSKESGMSGKTIGPSRRKFLSQVGAALAGGVVLGKAAVASAQSNPLLNREGGAPLATGAIDPRVK